MEGLVPVLCALLMSAEFAGGKKEPGRGGRGRRGARRPREQPSPPPPPGCPAGVNLSCYQCFKAASQALCTPTVCDPSDRVCVSNTVVLLRKSKGTLSLSKRCAPRCPNTNMNYEWTLGPRILGRIIRRCCSGNLCNRAPTIQQGPWALGRGFLLAAGLLWVLL
ncbi:lymphocyte antigen 6L isoform X2 [Ursus americanus]|uniref:lymphocyte antigen 6L isoform X2 n=1 Tax=Ursus americanus TaxID=9643 RepID=UPI001E679222|nr:lymphocyte antigen 6L isoform X2 [Ursus americanus]